MGELQRYRPPEQQEGASPQQRKPMLNYSKNGRSGYAFMHIRVEWKVLTIP